MIIWCTLCDGPHDAQKHDRARHREYAGCLAFEGRMMVVADKRGAIDHYFSPALQHAVLGGVDHVPMLAEFKTLADDPELDAAVARAVACAKKREAAGG